MQLAFRLNRSRTLLLCATILTIGFGLIIPFIYAQSPIHNDSFIGDVEELDNPTISWRAPLF